MREEIGHHAPELALEGLHALHLGPEQGAELVGEVYLAPVVVFRGAGVEAECPRPPGRAAAGCEDLVSAPAVSAPTACRLPA